MGFSESDPRSQLSLPPGFRFYPTDEELLVQYLCRKVAGHHFSLQIIGEVDLYKYDPWVLPSMATFGEKEWYFFSPRDRKYPNGSRPNRVAGSGYWKATGTDKLITTEGRKVGIKKALVFYVGKAPKGTKTNWIMHEYRLLEPSRKHGSSKLDDWVLCRIYKKNSSAQKTASSVVSSMEQYSNGCSSSSSSSHRLDDMLESLPEAQGMTSLHTTSSSKQEDYKPLPGLRGLNSGNFDWASLAALNSFPELLHGSHHQNQTPQQQTQGTLSFNSNNMQCFPSTPQQQQLGRVEEEVQSGHGGQQRVRVGNPGFAQPELETSQYSNGLDPFGFRCPSLPTGFGFRP